MHRTFVGQLFTIVLLPTVLGILFALPQNCAAQSAAPTPSPTPVPSSSPSSVNYGTQYNGLFDGYYLYQFKNPKATDVLTGRVYDVRNNEPTMAMAELNVFKNPRPHGLGYKATLVDGDDTDINHYDFDGASGGKGEARFKNVQQLYATYSFSADGSGIDFGKFVTPFGYETIEANGNNNYSHSIPFGLEPTYQFGVRLYTSNDALKINGLVATAYIANALYNTQSAGVQDDNHRPAYIGQLLYTAPNGKLTLTSTLGLSTDKFDFIAFSKSDVESKELLNDNCFIYNLSGSTSIGLNYMMATFHPEGAANETLNGIGAYYHHVLTSKTGFALRFSSSKLKTDGVSLQPNPYELTATYQIKPASNFTTFLEYRHDSTNVANSFLDSSSQLTQEQQDSVSVAGVFTF